MWTPERSARARRIGELAKRYSEGPEDDELLADASDHAFSLMEFGEITDEQSDESAASRVAHDLCNP